MAASETLRKLQTAGIVREGSDEMLRLHPSFEDDLDDLRAEFSAESPDERIASLVTDPDEREALLSLPSEALAEYVAIANCSDDFTHGERLRVLTVVDQFRRGSPPASGCPDAFVPVYGDRLDVFVRLYERSLVYVWREDCPPCDRMRADFEELFPTRPADLMLVAVYGPESPRLLQEEFDVTGGPTTLFVRDGSVDARLYGARDPETIEREVEKLREF